MKLNVIYFVLSLFIISGCTEKEKTFVQIDTELGKIEIELFSEKAPKTVKNFLQYVDGNHYENTSFYRSVTMDNQPDNEIKIEVIQGGIFEDKDIFPPVEHETTKITGIKHLDGVISMARNKPGSAADDFFICVGNQPELDFRGKRNPDGQGFAAFGKVTKGMDIVKKIHLSYIEGQYLNPKIRVKNITRIKTVN